MKTSIKQLPMFKIAFLAIALSLAGLTPAAALQPGCDPEFKGIQDNHAQANVIKDTAYAKEIIERPDSVLALSCFDQAMAASAKAGHIFSDREPEFLPEWGGIIATGLGGWLEGPFGPGTTTTLGEQIDTVVNPVLGDILSVFGDSLSGVIGGVLTSAFSDIVGPLIGNTAFGSLLGGLLGVGMDCTVGQEVLDEMVIGQGINKDVSYVSFEELITRGVDWGLNAEAQIFAPENSGILDGAVIDRENLRTPGYFPFTPITPVIPPNVTVDDIIANM